MEVFVNYTTAEYYFNRVYIEDMAIKNIEVRPNYAIIIGEDEHFIIEHSIYN